MTTPTTVRLDDGRVFPQYSGEPLSWSPGAYDTSAEKSRGYPRLHAVVAAMAEHRPDELRREWRAATKASFGGVFGPAAREYLGVLERAAGPALLDSWRNQ
jgi:hypothetical protein